MSEYFTQKTKNLTSGSLGKITKGDIITNNITDETMKVIRIYRQTEIYFKAIVRPINKRGRLARMYVMALKNAYTNF